MKTQSKDVCFIWAYVRDRDGQPLYRMTACDNVVTPERRTTVFDNEVTCKKCLEWINAMVVTNFADYAAKIEPLPKGRGNDEM